MSAKKGRRAKPQKPVTQGGPAMEDTDTPNLSVIERASFMEGHQQNFGPLHSTAMEEDLNVPERQRKEDGKAGGEHPPKTSKASVKQSGDVVKRKNVERDAESEEEQKKKRSRRSTVGTVKSGPEKEVETKKKEKEGAPQGQRGKSNTKEKESDAEGVLETPAASGVRRLVAKRPAGRKRSVQTSAAGNLKDQQVKKGEKRGGKSGSGKSMDSEPQEESDADAVQQRQRSVLPSDEDVTDDDTSWNPSQKESQRKRSSSGRNRKSLSTKSGTPSSDGASEDPDEEDEEDEQRSKKRGSQAGTELEVVLDTFTDFCDQYSESVESKAVKQSIKSFCSSVQQQLTEKISAQKELRILKRKNAKVGSLIRKKTQRLLDAKHEMMRADRQLTSLKKEKSELKKRLTDLRRGQTFLCDLRELNRLYLDYRHKHPKKKETYGASSRPALQLETKQIKAAEHKHKEKSNQLTKRQKMNLAQK